MFRYDPLRTGHNPFESEIGVGNVASLQEAWTADIDPSLSSPAVANGVAYVGSGNVLAVFDADGVTGCAGTSKPCTPLWTAVTADVVTSPTIANGVVYVVAGNTSTRSMPMA
jgi:outer membrane protein assembly factor BamB